MQRLHTLGGTDLAHFDDGLRQFLEVEGAPIVRPAFRAVDGRSREANLQTCDARGMFLRRADRQFLRSAERLPVQHSPQRKMLNSTLCVNGFHHAMQLSRANHPVGALLAAITEHVQVVGTTIEHRDETDSGGGRPDLIDHAAPDLGLARTLQA